MKETPDDLRSQIDAAQAKLNNIGAAWEALQEAPNLHDPRCFKALENLFRVIEETVG